ncbi:hypothetical protein R3P38DRAFT_3219007 [Favolaschia claudopus]|uniref:Uncharacterized protein n=1 Tax=Favolaschia claudopus TaxID=2862362 RepID=A0AAW0A1Y8_9AGAR
MSPPRGVPIACSYPDPSTVLRACMVWRLTHLRFVVYAVLMLEEDCRNWDCDWDVRVVIIMRLRGKSIKAKLRHLHLRHAFDTTTTRSSWERIGIVLGVLVARDFQFKAVVGRACKAVEGRLINAFPHPATPVSHPPFSVMLSLRYQQSTTSLLSYWSDNMSIGPNLPLHTLSKPAMRFLYRLQVRKFIKANEDHPLSEEIMEVFDSYLGYKYISSATKRMILHHLHSRLESLEVEECFSTMEMGWTSASDTLRIQVSAFRRVASNKLRNWVMQNQTPDVLGALKYFSFTYRHCLPTYDRLNEWLAHEVSGRLSLLADDDLRSFMSSGLALIASIHDYYARIAAYAAIFERTSAETSPPAIQDLTLDVFTSFIG